MLGLGILISRRRVTVRADALKAPAQNWRLPILAASDDAGDLTLQAALTQQHVEKSLPNYIVSKTSKRILTLDFPAVNAPGGLIYFISERDVLPSARRSFDLGATYQDLPYSRLCPESSARAHIGQRGQIINLPEGPPSKVQFIIENLTNSPTRVCIKTHQLPESGRADIWMVVGASLEEGMKSLDFYQQWREKFQNYDPIFFSFAKSGASGEKVKALTSQSILAAPLAQYFLLDIGGNNITAGRPYKEGQLLPLGDMIDEVHGVHKIALPSRLTYRNYRAPNAVDGTKYQEYGSLPYNLNLIDPSIKAKAPEAYDHTYNIGRMDWYSLTLKFRNELGDGIHHTQVLKRRSLEMWADVFGSWIYTGLWPKAYVEKAVEDAEISREVQDHDSAFEVVSSLPHTQSKGELLKRLSKLAHRRLV